MKLADFPNVQALSTAEKLQLVDEIWAVVAADISGAKITAVEKRLLDQRWSKYEQNPQSALTLNELKKKIAVSRK
jgi:putative addiction module component (TIGR02574 family)